MKRTLMCLLLFTLCRLSYAAYPEKPVAVIVPFPAGGSTDVVARTMGLKMTEKLGQSFIIDNRPGATGAIGAGIVKRAAPDGYTLLVASIGVWAVNPFLQKNLPYDPAKDFDLLTVAVRAPNVLVVHPSIPTHSVAELVHYMKKNASKVTFASSGAGSSDHLTAELFWQKTATKGLHVPYKGGAPAVADLLGGHVDASFQNLNVVVPHVNAGKMKALAQTGTKRSAQLPNVPTMEEAGVRDVVVYSWQAAGAPKGLQPDVKAKLHKAMVEALGEPQTRRKMEDQGFEIVANTPEQFAQFLQQELARWKQVIETGHITLD
ncbi:MAG: Bug family tripartite tricarboxylate transporter substrate binding protein [Rhodospirillaceae bacterium]